MLPCRLIFLGSGVNGSSVEENQALIEPFVKDRQIFRQRLISAVEFGKTIEVLMHQK